MLGGATKQYPPGFPCPRLAAIGGVHRGGLGYWEGGEQARARAGIREAMRDPVGLAAGYRIAIRQIEVELPTPFIVSYLVSKVPRSLHGGSASHA